MGSDDLCRKELYERLQMRELRCKDGLANASPGGECILNSDYVTEGPISFHAGVDLRLVLDDRPNGKEVAKRLAILCVVRDVDSSIRLSRKRLL